MLNELRTGEEERVVLRGNVDGVTRAGVTGWAASEEAPDSVVEVSIFVDGREVAQIECASHRLDLEQLGVFGNGAHGFRFNFPTPLGAEVDRRVTVRFSVSGKLLARGDVLLRRDDTTLVNTPKHNRLIGVPEPLPAPHDPRGLFEALALLDDTSSVQDLLARFNFDGLTAKHVHFAVFGHLSAERTDENPLPRSYSARRDINNLLLSDDFQTNVIALFLMAFPEKKRLIFIHVPKCAGTDLSANLMKKVPFLHQQMTQSHWLAKDDLFRALSRLVLNIRFFDDLFVTGHNSLGYYTARRLIRPSDKVFTILRDPIQIAISQVNYVMTRLVESARTGTFSPDTREWMNFLNIDTLPFVIDPVTVQELCSRILRTKQITQPNSMCFWLGGNDAESAIEQLADADVEITTTENYEDWLRQVWGITTTTRLNRSETFTSADMMSHQDLSYVQEVYSEDIKLYRTIYQTLQQGGKLSVSGDTLQ